MPRKEKKQIDLNEYLEWWLIDNFGKTLEQTKAEGWLEDNSRDFFIAHRISHEAYERWKARVVEDLNQVHKMTKKMIENCWWQIELGPAPSVFPDEDINLKNETSKN